jgi:16S rRNA (adenine1518-N6/adenine1519-N6)-dimethyltransferase
MVQLFFAEALSTHLTHRGVGSLPDDLCSIGIDCLHAKRFFVIPTAKEKAMTSPQTLLKAWNLRARKKLGQNFLKDDRVARRIVDHARLDQDDVVLEIGSGLGMMTIAAASQVRKVVAVEKDRHLLPLLRAELLVHGLTHVQIFEDNILKLPLASLAGSETQPFVVLGNLPYNISSQIVVKLIEERQYVDRAIVMFQKELADRLCAGPGTKVYGRLSVRLQYCADLTPLMQVHAVQFHPRPKVDSAVLGITFKKRIEHAVKDEQLFARVVQAAFGQRRKNLRNALSGGLLPLDRPAVVRLLEASEIDPRWRAETLSVDAFVKLTNHIADYLAGNH